MARRRNDRRAAGRRFSLSRDRCPRRVENLAQGVAIYFVWANFLRPRREGFSAAMDNGLTDRLWTAEDLSAVLEDWLSPGP